MDCTKLVCGTISVCDTYGLSNYIILHPHYRWAQVFTEAATLKGRVSVCVGCHVERSLVPHVL